MEHVPPVTFSRPPVVETVLGVQFLPLRRLTAPYAGLYWGEIRQDYPTQEVKSPLAPSVEAPSAPSETGIRFFAEPEVRCWFIDAEGAQLIQVQRDRFVRNWRKTGGAPEYPRYGWLRPAFQRDWERFLRFLEREDLGGPEVNQCEVTYINHIEQGAGWQSFGDLAKVLNLVARPESKESLPEPEMLVLNVRYGMPDDQGRLHVTAQPAIRRHDRKLVLQLTLMARGRPRSPAIGDIMAWFDLGHDWIVRGFVDVTTPRMHEIWGRR